MSDEHENSNQYILIVEITAVEDESDSTKPNLNSPPYFDEIEWSENVPILLTRNGDEVIFDFPEP